MRDCLPALAERALLAMFPGCSDKYHLRTYGPSNSVWELGDEVTLRHLGMLPEHILRAIIDRLPRLSKRVQADSAWCLGWRIIFADDPRHAAGAKAMLANSLAFGNVMDAIAGEDSDFDSIHYLDNAIELYETATLSVETGGHTYAYRHPTDYLAKSAEERRDAAAFLLSAHLVERDVLPGLPSPVLVAAVRKHIGSPRRIVELADERGPDPEHLAELLSSATPAVSEGML